MISPYLFTANTLFNIILGNDSTLFNIISVMRITLFNIKSIIKLHFCSGNLKVDTWKLNNIHSEVDVYTDVSNS